MKTVLLIGPVPPPFHGASYAIELLIKSNLSNYYNIKHINTTFVDSIHEFQQFSLKKIGYFFKYFFQIIRTLINLKIDIVIICPAFNRNAFLKDGIYTFICKKIFNKPVIWWVHNSGLEFLNEKNNFFGSLIVYFFKLTTFIVTVGERLQVPLKKWVNEQVLTHNHNGLPVDGTKANKLHPSPVTICYLSNMIESKGWRILFNAAEQICKTHNDVNFHFYGKAESESAHEIISGIFSKTSYKGNIRYFGPVYGEDKIEALSNADIFCFPTYYPIEAFPIVILEAMQYSLPVVTTNHAAIPEAIIDGKGGFTIPIKDERALIEKLDYLITHPEQRVKMGKFNRDRFETHFTLEKHIERWHKILENVS